MQNEKSIKTKDNRSLTRGIIILILAGLLAAGVTAALSCARAETKEVAVSKVDDVEPLTMTSEHITELTESFEGKQRALEKKLEETVSYYESMIEEQKKSHEGFVRLMGKKHADEIDRIVLTYNPVFSSDDVNSILERHVDRDILETPVLREYRNVFHKENLFSTGDFEKLRMRLADISLLIDRLQEIPYTNSIPAVIDQIEYTALVLVRDYEDLWRRAADLIEGKNLKIKQFSQSLDYLVKENRENGYIIDPTDADRIAVHINSMHRISRAYKVEDGDMGYVFRRDDEPVGTIRFSVSSDGITASLLELVSPEKPILPFDKILINLN